jgi:hypothetical protein
MTRRDPKHTANQLPWEAPQPGHKPFHNAPAGYVLSREDAMIFLLVSAERLQGPCCDDDSCEAYLAACDAWWSLFLDMNLEDQLRVGRALEAGTLHPPFDPQGR